MNSRKAGYWAATALVAFTMIAGGAADLALIDPAREMMDHLGYPHYFARMIGVWKILGGIAIVVPGFRRLKEWAYAGIFFDLTGAAISHLAVGDGAKEVLTPLVFAVIMVVSYVLLPARDRA